MDREAEKDEDEGGKAEDPSSLQSLYYGLDALMATAGSGKEAVR